MPLSRLARVLFASLLAAFTFAAPAWLSGQTIPTSGQPVPSLAQLDTIMQQYMTQYNSPGANLSVSVDGRLVFARGYGYANTATGEFVQPDSRMRLASNSKPFTAAAIYKLIEQGKLSLSTKPFATIFTDLTAPAGKTVDPRIYNITVQNLLEHKAGYDDGAGYPFDPVNDYPTNRAAAAAYGLTGQAITPKVLIEYEMGVALQHDPGTTYAYSNLGYLTLGYIIERVTNTPYATWLEQNIFPLANMQQTLPAGNLASQKLPYEVAYYGQEGSGPSMIPPVGTTVPYEYGALDLNLELANGGWTSTPMDLLRFNDSLNGQFTTNILASPPSGFTGEIPPLGQGWGYVFYGSLPGTNSLVHLDTSSDVVGRVVYSAIFNTRSGSNLEEPESDADNAILAFVKTVKAWPTGDLFPTYATATTACSFSLASATASAPMAGNTGSDAFTDANYCAWSAVSNATWLHVTSSAINNTSGTIAYTTDPNTGASRTGTITAGGQILTVTQAGVTTPTTLTATGTKTYDGTTSVLKLTAKLSPYSATGASTDGEVVTFYFPGVNTGAPSVIGTAKLASGVASLTMSYPGQTGSQFYASFPGDTTFSASVSSIVFTSSSSATLTPATLTFPATPQGTVSAAQTLTLTNTGSTTLNFSTILISGAFKQTNTCGGSLAANGTCTFSVTFNPTTSSGTLNGTLEVDDEAGAQTASFTGTATAAAPVVTLNPTSLTFASTTVNTTSAPQLVTVTNTGNAPLSITGVSISGGATQFAQTNTCTAAPIAANATCTVSVTFTPSAATTYSNVSVLIASNATPATASVTLFGTGVAGPAPAVTLAPGSLTFPATQVASTSAAQTVMLTNSGTAALSITGITASAGFAQTNNCPASLAANATCTISVTSTPAAVGAYTGTVSLADNASNSPQSITLSGTGAAFSAPTITATATAASLTYGQSVTINASATGVQPAGSYTWSLLDGSSVVTSGVAYSASFSFTVPTPTAGNRSYTAVLTSTAPATYPNGTSNAVSVTVAKASTSATFPAPASITYGTPLGNAQLAATSATPGAFAYTPPAGTVLAAGTQALSATLTPTDATDYAASTATTSILVNKAALSAVAVNASRPYGAANPTLTGTLTGIVNADAITASYTSSATVSAAAGTTAPITPMLADPANRLVNYNVTTTAGVLTITKAATTATLTGPASTPAGTAVTLTATIASTTTGTPTGMVTFSVGGTMIGTGTLTNGSATVSYTPPSGSTTVTVAYAGDGNFNASTGTLVVTTGLPDFSVTAAPPSATITAGQSATFTLTATAINGFSQSVFYSCANLPAHTSCLFVPFYVSPASSAQTSQLIIATDVASASLTQPVTGWGRGITGTALAFLLGLPLLRRRSRAVRRSLLSIVVLLGLGGVLALSGCGANNFVNPALNQTPTGTYTVTVNASTYGGATHTSTLSVTVQ